MASNKPSLPAKPIRGETLQIEARRLGRDHQGKRRRVRRHDQILAQSAFQAQTGDAEGAILIVEMDIDGVVAALRHCPTARRVAFHTRSVAPPRRGTV